MPIAAQSSESWFSNSPKWPETPSATLLSRYQVTVCTSISKIPAIAPDTTVVVQHSLGDAFLLINPFVCWSCSSYNPVILNYIGTSGGSHPTPSSHAIWAVLPGPNLFFRFTRQSPYILASLSWLPSLTLYASLCHVYNQSFHFLI